MWEISVSGGGNKFWRLTDDDTSEVFIEAGTVSGMVATSTENVVRPVGGHGHQVASRRVETLAPTWTVVFDDMQGRGLGALVSEWLTAWRRGVTVRVKSRVGVVTAEGRIPAEVAIDLPDNPFSEDMKGGFMRVPWTWLSDSAVWKRSQSFRGDGKARTITNAGDVALVPSVTWDGTGKTLRLVRNGMTSTFALPAVAGPVTMRLDHADNCVVRGRDGVKYVAASAWSRNNAIGLSTVVKPGGSVSVTASAGVSVSWSEGFVNPWF